MYFRTETLLELAVTTYDTMYTVLYFRLIYFTARNVKEMLFEKRGEKFVQCDVEILFFFSIAAAINAQKRFTVFT